jgi:hypothetical protein
MNNDEAVIEKLALAVDHLLDAGVLIRNGVSNEAWPMVSRSLGQVMTAVRGIELELIGHVS